mgnify:CR=1 FL=1
MPAHYGRQWQCLRKKFLAKHPKCKRCGAKSTDVDHIRAVRDDPDLLLNWHNLRALCHSCHSKRTNNDQVHADKCSPAGLDGYPTDPDHPWNQVDQKR